LRIETWQQDLSWSKSPFGLGAAQKGQSRSADTTDQLEAIARSLTPADRHPWTHRLLQRIVHALETKVIPARSAESFGSEQTDENKSRDKSDRQVETAA
jgi:hypothetical protein